MPENWKPRPLLDPNETLEKLENRHASGTLEKPKMRPLILVRP